MASEKWLEAGQACANDSNINLNCAKSLITIEGFMILRSRRGYRKCYLRPYYNVARKPCNVCCTNNKQNFFQPDNADNTNAFRNYFILLVCKQFEE